MVVLGAGGTGGASLAGDLLAVANLFVFTVYFLVIKHRRGAGAPAPSRSWPACCSVPPSR